MNDFKKDLGHRHVEIMIDEAYNKRVKMKPNFLLSIILVIICTLIAIFTRDENATPEFVLAITGVSFITSLFIQNMVFDIRINKRLYTPTIIFTSIFTIALIVLYALNAGIIVNIYGLNFAFVHMCCLGVFIPFSLLGILAIKTGLETTRKHQSANYPIKVKCVDILIEKSRLSHNTYEAIENSLSPAYAYDYIDVYTPTFSYNINGQDYTTVAALSTDTVYEIGKEYDAFIDLKNPKILKLKTDSTDYEIYVGVGLLFSVIGIIGTIITTLTIF